MHEDQVIRLVENNHPPISLLFSSFLLFCCGFAFLVYPSLRCSWMPGRKTIWSEFRIPLSILASGLWGALPLTWATTSVDERFKEFSTRQTVLSGETSPKGGCALYVTSWRGSQREKLSTVGGRLDEFLPGNTVDIGLVTNKAGMLNVTRVDKVSGGEIPRSPEGGI